MLVWISWGQYWSGVAAVAVVYYAYLVWRYYGRRGFIFWRRIAEQGRSKNGQPDQQGSLFSQENLGVGSPDPEQWAALMMQVKGLLETAAKTGMPRMELIACIRETLMAHRDLRGTPVEEAVSELLRRAFRKQLGLTLGPDDLAWLWGGQREVVEAKGNGGHLGKGAMMILVLLAGLKAGAQTADGNAGITQANTLIRGYFTTAVQLMYAIGAIVGLVGAVHVYIKWSRGDHDTQRVAMAWFGACIFLVVVATVIQSFFGL